MYRERETPMDLGPWVSKFRVRFGETNPRGAKRWTPVSRFPGFFFWDLVQVIRIWDF